MLRIFCAVHSFSIGENRSVVVGENNIMLCDSVTKEYADLTFKRWKVLRDEISDIDAAIRKVVLTRDNVQYRCHLGMTWFVTITSGVWCVDIRKYYKTEAGRLDDHSIDVIRPTKIGISVQFQEWWSLKEAMNAVNDARPDIACVEQCFHQSQQGKYLLIV
jgi:Transcriptional Coactivator p15 (PC4)